MARQKLGQHFLTQSSILDRIAAAVCPETADLVIEIGPGRGALTEKLLGRARRVVAVEVDRELAEHLRTRFAGSRLEVIHGDVLSTDLGQWGAAPVAGNLPYYIASPIIDRVVRLRFPRAVFLIQKEVAERLIASPRSRDYGFLTVQTAVFATARMLFTVKPGAFRPPPKVDSAVVLLEPRAPAGEEDGFVRFAGLCFRQKRKTIRNNLIGEYGEQVSGWPEAGMRAEQLSIEQLRAMYLRVHG